MVGVAPDQGAVGETWLFYRPAKMPRVQANFLFLFLLGGGGGGQILTSPWEPRKKNAVGNRVKGPLLFSFLL